MISFTTQIQKMKTEEAKPIQYFIQGPDKDYIVNEWLGKNLLMKFTGNIHCVYCGEKTKKSFGQGYCYKHFISLAQCDMCVIKPETCHYHEGTCREPEWGQENCMIDHYVYLSDTSSVKVGITREYNLPSRWFDQGATRAMALLRVPNRLMSGKVETRFKEFIGDKTNWRNMLKGLQSERDLASLGPELLEKVDLSDLEYEVLDTGLEEFEFPVLEHPEKIKSLNFDKDPVVEGKFLGVKAQYLILDIGVINLRKFSGYEVEFQIS